MKQKIASFRINAMQRDVNPAVSGAAKENQVHIYAYENYNMRMNAVVEGEQFAMVNERGPKEIVNMGAVAQIQGIPIGQNVLNNTLTLFTVDEGDLFEDVDITNEGINTGITHEEDVFNIDLKHTDRIYTFNSNNSSEVVDGKLIYKGNLGFNYHNPIETTSYFENEKLRKVYWIDGKNQPRVINIAAEDEERELWKNTKFDFVRTLKLQEQVTITKNNDSSGMFNAGTIQYCMTYFDKYGQESNIFYISPLYYITYNDRGAATNDTVSNSFEININNLDTSFDYVRVYSIHRSETDGTPSCNIVADLLIDKDSYGWITLVSFIEENVLLSDIKIKLRENPIRFGLDEIIEGGYLSLIDDYVCSVTENTNSETIIYKFNPDTFNYHVSQIYITGEGFIYPQTDMELTISYNRLSKTVTIKQPATRTLTRRTSMRAYMNMHPSVTFTDTGTTNSLVDKFSILYSGGVEISADTMAHKDNVLFLGNIKLKNKDIYDVVIRRDGYRERKLYEALQNATDKSVFCYRNDVKFLKAWNANSYYSYDFQLNNNEYEIKTFKSREWYRFGLQFQHKSGVWSEPVWIGDAYNNLHPDCAYVNPKKDVGLVTAEFDFSKLNEAINIIPNDFVNTLTDAGYVKVRPVAVYPEFYERECVCQGYLNPTVFNYGDRMNGQCYAQASWFARPVITYSKNISKTEYDDFIQKDNTSPYTNDSLPEQHKFVTGYSGRPLEYRHLCPIPTSKSFSSEIQSIFNHKDFTMYEDEHPDTRLSKEEFLSKYSGYFGIDQSIVTLHTPDIDALKNLELSKYKLRIVGMVPLTSFAGNIDITTSTAGLSYSDAGIISEDNASTEIKNDKFLKPHVFNPKITLQKPSINGANIMGAGSYYSSKIYSENAKKQTDHIGWYDAMIDRGNLENSQRNTAVTEFQKTQKYSVLRPYCFEHNPVFIVYPWHRSTSFINQNFGDVIFSKPDKKRLSNLRYSYNTFYFDNMWKPKNQLSDCQLIDSDETSFTKLNVSGHNGEEEVLYKSSVDCVIPVQKEYSSKLVMPEAVYTDVTGYEVIGAFRTEEQMYQMDFTSLSDIIPYEGKKQNEYVNQHKYSTDPIHMKYKSSPHIVLSLKGAISKSVNGDTVAQNILPCFQMNEYPDTNIAEQYKQGNRDFFGYSPYSSYYMPEAARPFWDKSICQVNQDVIYRGDFVNTYERTLTGDNSDKLNRIMSIDYNDKTLCNKIYGFLWLGEIYNDEVENRFGGTSSNALENNKWVICGEAVDIKEDTVVSWIGGDTYYQRYDNLKTYPYTLEDVNSVVDIISFMCETRVNIDGRSDRNRGLRDNTYITPNIFNLMNSGYTQDNNFFPINYYDPSKIRLQNFNNIVTWTTTKTAGSLIDKWTNVTLAATLDMDGDKGGVTMLKVFNNTLYSFQPKGLSIIKFNSNVALSTTEGTPVELANSGRVEGKEYLFSNIGCSNKWASAVTQNGIYFIDDLNRGFYGFNGQLSNISEKQGFDVMFEENSNADIKWNPVDFNNAVMHYDNDNHEVYITYKDKSLAYSEMFGAFTSFYSYDKVPFFPCVNGREIMVMHNNNDNVYKLWDYQKGEYNMFFGINKDYYTEFIVNDIPDYIKIFDTVEFTADAFDGSTPIHDYTFNVINVKDSYQSGSEELVWKQNVPSSLKKKFRTWRTPVPRHIFSKENTNVIKHDRIQDHWAYIKLLRKTNADDNKRHILYNTSVYYYI